MIGDEPGNTDCDPEPSEKAVSQGEGGACVPLLPALRQDLPREDILRHAYALARANAGAPGVDGITFAAIEASGLQEWLAGLREELISKTYRPDPVRRVMIPKPNGEGERPLGIPTIRDRVISDRRQDCAGAVLRGGLRGQCLRSSSRSRGGGRGQGSAPADLPGLYRRGRRLDGWTADFDSIPHDELLKSVARRIVDRHVLRLIKLWLKAPIEERDDGDGTRRIGGGKSNSRGTPQGGVVSPMLANIYMNRFLKYWRLTGRGEAFCAHVVAYADDFVILSRGCAAEALAWTKAVMTRLGLTVNEAKTSLKNARQERFDFLGYSFGTSPLQSERSLVSEREPVQEKRTTVQDQGRQSAGAWQQRSVASSARHAEQVSAWLVELLLPRNVSIGIPWC